MHLLQRLNSHTLYLGTDYLTMGRGPRQTDCQATYDTPGCVISYTLVSYLKLFNVFQPHPPHPRSFFKRH